MIEESGDRIPAQVEALGPASEIVEGLRVARVNPAETSKAIEALRARSDVIYAEPNFVRKATRIPNDPLYPQMWGLNNTGQSSTSGGNPGTPGNDIRAEQAWNMTTGSRSIVVGVVDSGIDVNHEDLRDNVWTNPGEIPGNGLDDDANGFIDDIHGWDFAHNDATVFDYSEPVYPPSSNYTGDVDDHGTHVAGTIGATGDNGIGVAGVNWQVSLMSLKFLTGGFGTSANIIKALSYARTMRELWLTSGGAKGANIRILNNSYGGEQFSQAELDAIRALSDSGILFVAAAGNEGLPNDQFPAYPSNYISPNLISVAASAGGGTRASFSNYGEGTVNVTAPGQHILSTTPRNTYEFFSGTSMAAPHVAGGAALICAAFPNITMQQLRAAIMYRGYVAPWQYSNNYPISTGRAVDANTALQGPASADLTPPGAINNLSAQIADAFPSYTVNWTATGDDGNVGKVAAYEVRFSETAFTDANFDLGTPLSSPIPRDPGNAQGVTVKVPWRHASGFIGVRAVDDAGNKGPISSLPISVAAGVSDPYTSTEIPAASLSVGGTPVGLVTDDGFKTMSLPFSFKHYGLAYSSVTLSSNGALYFGFAPSEDSTSSERGLNGNRMIAGLWDDLRTDRRPGDDVYMVGDADRVIFRWQAVTYDTPTGPGQSRGENPVNFEIELRYDGTITVRYGDGNQKVFPVVGLGGGWPQPYISTSHTAEEGFKDLSYADTVVFARRDPILRDVLTVASSNPAGGVNISVSPNDAAGLSAGTTQFTRSYNPGAMVTLTAPAIAEGKNFQKWQRNGVDWSTSPTTSVALNGNVTMTAVFAPPTTYVLTVASLNPASSVNIAVTPNDNNGAGNAATQFTRTYNPNTNVNLTAPATVNGNQFWKWQVNGVDLTTSHQATVTMTGNLTATAVYGVSAPTPNATPVPGAAGQPLAVVRTGTSPNSGGDIFLVNPDGTNAVNITDAPGQDLNPAWSGDGSRLAYNCQLQPDGSINGPLRICVRNADGTGFAVLSNTLAEDWFPAWSHDNTRIAFTSVYMGSQSTIYIMDADGSGRHPMNVGFLGASNPDWSPDDKSIAFDLVNSIWVYNLSTATGLRLTNGSGDWRPRYSPNGAKIVFQSNRDGNAEIYVMNADGTGQTRLTNNPAYDSNPVWSPDGSKIVFSSSRDNPMSPSLYVMNADGSNTVPAPIIGSSLAWRRSLSVPVVMTAQGTNDALALDSVTFLRGPFRVLNSHNFSPDRRTRIIIFTSDLGMTQQNPATTLVSVHASGVSLPVERVGPMTGATGMSGSFLIVKLPDGLPAGSLSLVVTAGGLSSAATNISITP